MTLASQLKLTATVLTSSLLAACASADYTPLSFTPKGDHFVLNGVIDELSLEDFNSARQAHPKIKHLVFENIPGSVDDETNLKLARKIRSLGIDHRIARRRLSRFRRHRFISRRHQAHNG